MSVLRRIVGPPPFAHLAWTNALSPAADAFFTVSLAGSLFFNVSVGAARPRVVVYLLLTLAPFVVLAPLVGPLIDRYGRARPAVLASTCLGRGILCLFVAGDLRNVLLYPEAFGVLVLEKAYSVAKSALVPTLVLDDVDLVSANARLARISTIAGLLAGASAAAVLTLSSATGGAAGRFARLFRRRHRGDADPSDNAPTVAAALLEREQLRAPEDPIRIRGNERASRQASGSSCSWSRSVSTCRRTDVVLRCRRGGQHRRRPCRHDRRTGIAPATAPNEALLTIVLLAAAR